MATWPPAEGRGREASLPTVVDAVCDGGECRAALGFPQLGADSASNQNLPLSLLR